MIFFYWWWFGCRDNIADLITLRVNDNGRLHPIVVEEQDLSKKQKWRDIQTLMWQVLGPTFGIVL